MLKLLKDNYEKLPKSKIDEEEFVIFATGKFEGEYGYGSSDLESYGIDKNGKLYWIYASGCSCHCDTWSEEKDIKVFEITEKDPTDILKQFELFNLDKDEFLKGIKSYDYENF